MWLGGNTCSCVGSENWTSRIGLGFELPSDKSVVGPNGPKIENEAVWKWLQVLDSREIHGAPKEIQTPDPLFSE